MGKIIDRRDHTFKTFKLKVERDVEGNLISEKGPFQVDRDIILFLYFSMRRRPIDEGDESQRLLFVVLSKKIEQRKD